MAEACALGSRPASVTPFVCPSQADTIIFSGKGDGGGSTTTGTRRLLSRFSGNGLGGTIPSSFSFELGLPSGDAVFRRFLRPLFGSTSNNSTVSVSGCLVAVDFVPVFDFSLVADFMGFLLSLLDAFSGTLEVESSHTIERLGSFVAVSRSRGSEMESVNVPRKVEQSSEICG
jgi:hypothetical protein